MLIYLLEGILLYWGRIWRPLTTPGWFHFFLLSCVCVHSRVWLFVTPWAIAHLKEMGIPDHMTCLLRNLYACQEATVRTGHGKAERFQVGKGVRQGCILSPCLFNLYAEYIMWNTGLDEAQIGIKISGRNIKNLKYEEELKSLLMRVKEKNDKSGLKFNIQKTKILASGPITSWQMEGGVETVFLGLWNHCRWWLLP